MWSRKNPPPERKKERAKENKLKSTYLMRLNIKLIKHHKCGPRRFPEERRQAQWREKRSTHVRRRRFLLPELRLPSSSSSCVCLCARAGVWLSLILRGRRGSCWWAVRTLLSVHKCPPPSLCCLTITSLPNCGEEFAFIYSEVARIRCVGCKPWIPKALCCIHET